MRMRPRPLGPSSSRTIPLSGLMSKLKHYEIAFGFEIFWKGSQLGNTPFYWLELGIPGLSFAMLIAEQPF